MKLHEKIYPLLLFSLFVCCEDEKSIIEQINSDTPKVTVNEVKVKSSTLKVNLSASYTSANPSSITATGFYYIDSKNKSVKVKSDRKTSNSFSTDVVLRRYDETFKCKAYVSNGTFEIATEEISFKTLPFKDYVSLAAPAIETKGSRIHAKSSATYAEGVSPTEKGIMYGTTNDVSSATKVKSTSSSNEIDATLNNLVLGNNYYFWAYLQDGEYTAYSNVVSIVPHNVPSITTTKASEIDYTTALTGGTSISANGVKISSKGVVWSENSTPTVESSSKYSISGSNTDNFTYKLTGLRAGTRYYVRAFAINDDGVGYGQIESFSTKALQKPEMKTNSVHSITDTTSIVDSKIESFGGDSIRACGVVWSTLSYPTVSLTSKTSHNASLTSFSDTLTDLLPGTVYYVRSYATNSIGTGYGEQLTFTTLSSKPTVVSRGNPVIDSYSVTISGSVTSSGGVEVTERGVVWGKSENPTISNYKKTAGSGLGEFSVAINASELESNTIYFARPYARNSKGTAYGEQVCFSFGNVVPYLKTANVKEIESSSAVSGGNIIYGGGSGIIARGVVWSKQRSPMVEFNSKTVDGSGIGTFTSDITGLDPNTTYYVRAYATNSTGTGYGEEKVFTTMPPLPSVTTIDATLITSNSFQTGGFVESAEGSIITSRGVVWSTSEYPTVDLTTKIISGAGSGIFSCTITDLKANTTYYVRAYAVNANGTGYGKQIVVRTNSKSGTEGVGNTDFSW